MKKVRKLWHVIMFCIFGTFLLTNCGEGDTEDAQDEEQEEDLEEDDDLESEDLEEEPEDDMEEEIEDDLETETASTDWDEALTEYEEFVDEYIILLKKASEGDASATTEYPTVLQKAQDSSKKLGEAQGELSPEQLQRFMAIQQKLTKAASEIK